MDRKSLVERFKLWTGITGIPAASSDDVMKEARAAVRKRPTMANIRASGTPPRPRAAWALKRLSLRSVALLTIGIIGCVVFSSNRFPFGVSIVVCLAGVALAFFVVFTYFKYRKAYHHHN